MTSGRKLVRYALAAAAVVGVSALPRASLAGPAEHEAALREFEVGTKLIKQGDCPQAIEHFVASLAHEEGVGAHLNLADCYGRAGAFDRAWLELRLAERAATQIGDDSRREYAHGQAYALEQKLFRVAFTGPIVDGLEVRINDRRVDPDLVAGRLIAIAPGPFAVKIQAPNKVAKTQEGTGAAGGRTSVSTLLDDDAPAPAAPVPPPANAQPPLAPPPEAPPPSTTQRNIGLVVGGVGLATVVVGGVFGILALTYKSDLKSTASSRGCSYPDMQCSGSLRDELQPIEDRAFAASTASTVLFVAGGVMTAAGVTLLLTSPRSSRAAKLQIAPQVGGRAGGLVAVGSF